MIAKEDIRKQLPLRLREWLNNQNRFKTIAELSRYLEINKATLDDYFNGRNHPKGENLDKLIEVTHLPLLLQIKEASTNIKTNDNIQSSGQNRMKSNNQELSLNKAQEVHATIIKLNELLDYFKKANAEERAILRKTIPPVQIGYITSLIKALYNEDEFQQWILFSEYKLSK